MENKIQKGLRCDIYRGTYHSKSCILHDKKEITLIGAGIPEISEPTKDCPAVKLITVEQFGKQIPRGEPLFPGSEDVWFCFGGSFIYTSDSRFPEDHPIKLFDYKE
ncbi:MAG: hypothetical protein WC511_02485 [Candidatus Pacearchaeota archaeon]